MLNGRYVAIDRIIENIYRDYGFEHDLEWADVLEWAAHAVKLVGVPTSYVDMVKCIKITDYKGELPCNLHELTAVREKDSQTAMIYNGNTFYLSLLCETSSELVVNCNDNCDTSNDPDNPNCNPFFNQNPNPIQGTKFGSVTNTTSNHSTDIPTYQLNDSFMFTSFETGNVELAYKAFPTDNRGFPLIPDNIKFTKAVEAYIAHKISFKLWIRDEIRRDKKDAIEQEWLWYVGAAKTAGSMPSVDEMEAIKNEWTRAIPNINQHSTHFKYMGDPSRRYTNRP